MQETNHLTLISSITYVFYKILPFSLIFFSWILMYRWRQRNQRGPKKWPIIGATIELLRNYNRMHDWLADYLSESKTISVSLPFTTYTYIADPVNVEHILKVNFSNYPKGELYRSYMDVLLGDGIFNADGEMWKKQRKTASFEFASKNLRDFSTIVFREYATKLSGILCQASIANESIDMQDLFMRMTLDSICKVGFGVEIGTLSPELPDNTFAHAFDTANIIVTLRFVDPLWRIKRFLRVGSEALLEKCIKVVDEFTYDVIRKRKSEIVEAGGNGTRNKRQMKNDILSRFIELGEDPESDFSDDKSLRDVVLNFVIAGRDTTATTLSWFVYMIMTHPHVSDKIYSELKAFEERQAKEEKVTLTSYEADDINSFNIRISQFASLLNYDSLARLPYLHACITETLRLYPAVPQDPKGILEDDVLPDGTKVKTGGLVTYVPYSMGRMVYNWGEDAKSFKPERWFEDGVLRNVSPFKFTAFQIHALSENFMTRVEKFPSAVHLPVLNLKAGPRICLGKDSAYLQMKMTLAILCRFFTFTLVPNHPVHYRMMTILSMAHGLKLHVSRCV